jgi:hypothetical protein
MIIYGKEELESNKKSILEMYEDLMDNKVIDDFEKRELKGKAEFLSFEDIIK